MIGRLAAVAAIILPFFSATLGAQTTPLALTPPMGWNSWNYFGGKATDANIRAAADALVSTGMRDAGYVYVNIDDTWEGARDAQGNIQSNDRFPDMKALADYIHSRGLKFGIYSTPGPKTCAGFEGSYGHEQQDAQTYARWGVDYLKYDLCTFIPLVAKPVAGGDLDKTYAMVREAFAKMHTALVATHRPIVYSLSIVEDAPWNWASSVGANLWRTTGDVAPRYDRMSLIGFAQEGLAPFAGPGHWNDPDMLEVGNGGLNPDESRTQYSLWAILAAPLLAGNDLSDMNETTRSILMNTDVIAVDQDGLGIEGHRVSEIGLFEIWARPLAGGDVTVGLFNRSDAAYRMTVTMDQVGFRGPVHARDLWSHTEFDINNGSYTAVVPRHGVVMLRLTPHHS